MTARRVLPAVAVAAAVMAIGLAIAAFVRRPSGAAHRDRDAWAKAYTAARGCLLGAPPASEDVREALSAADLGSPNRTCGPELIALAALGGDDAGGPWTELRLALGRMADAFVARKLPAPGASTDPAAAVAAAERLGRTVAELDAAVTAVRPDLARVAAVRPTLATLSLVPIDLGGTPTKLGSLWRGQMWVTSAEDESFYQVRWNAGRPLVLAMKAGAVPVWSPAATWQAWVDTDGRSAVMAASDTGTEEKTVATADDPVTVLAAIGEDHRRLIVFRGGDRGWLARSVDNGRHWSKVALSFGYAPLSLAVAASGDSIELVWNDATTRRLVLGLDAASGPLPDDTSIGDAPVWNDCTTGALWVVLHDETTEQYVVRRATTDRDLLDVRENPVLEACSSGAALVAIGPRKLLCTVTGCRPVPPLTAEATSVVTGETLVRVAYEDDIVAVWRGDAAPAFYRAPAHRELRGVIDGGDRAVLVFAHDDELVEYAALEP